MAKSTLKGTGGSTGKGFFGFLKGKALPATPPVGDALGVLRAPQSSASAAAGTPPYAPFTPGQWAALAAGGGVASMQSMAAAIGRVTYGGGQRTTNIDLAPPPYDTADTLEYPGKVAGPEHDESVVSAARIIQYLLARFNPIRGLTPRRLEQDIEQWQLGFLRWLSLDWSFIRERDDQIIAVEAKRIFAVSRLEWEVMQMDDTPEADAHKEALEEFYDNLTCTSAINQNEQGGVALMVRQMMESVGFKFAVHEIIWKPDVNPDTGSASLTAELRYVPLWFFENRTGVLRYLPYELALDGIPLDQFGWMVTTGQGLQIVSCISWMYKQLALRAWVAFCEKFAIPFIHGETTAAFNSIEWGQFVGALQNFASDGVIATNMGAKLNMVAPPASANNPQEQLVDRMDRAMARDWRGADLSTMSRAGSGTGALPQIQNEDELAEADAIKCSEAANFYIDRGIVFYRFGKVKPKAYFRIIPPLNIDTAKMIAVYQFLNSVGVDVAKKDVYAAFGIRQPDAKDELITPPPTPADIGTGVADKGVTGALSLGNVADRRAMGAVFMAAARRELTAAQAKALVPVGERLKALADIQDPEKLSAAKEKFKKDLPELLKVVDGHSNELRQALTDIIGTSILSGATQAASRQGCRV